MNTIMLIILYFFAIFGCLLITSITLSGKFLGWGEVNLNLISGN